MRFRIDSFKDLGICQFSFHCCTNKRVEIEGIEILQSKLKSQTKTPIGKESTVVSREHRKMLQHE